MIKDCLICSRIIEIENGGNLHFVKELKTGYVVLEDFQFYKGYTIFISKKHVDELHELGSSRFKFLKEMAIVAEAVYKTFKPKKLNYELLGNSESHLHWHIIPRYREDINPSSPIWIVNKKIRQNPNTNLPSEFLRLSITELKSKIEELYET